MASFGYAGVIMAEGIDMIGSLHKIKPFLTSMIFSYLVIAGILVLIVNFQAIAGNAQAETLSRLMPSFRSFADYVLEGKPIPVKELKDARFYFRKVNEYREPRPDTYALLGWVYYQLGEVNKSIDAFSKAIELNPVYFWNYYNLGVIYYERGDLARAQEFLGKSLEVPLPLTFQFLMTGKVFWPILIKFGDEGGGLLEHNATIARQKAAALLATISLLPQWKKISDLGNAQIPLKGIIYGELGKKAYENADYQRAAFFFQKSLQEKVIHPKYMDWMADSIERLESPADQVEFLRNRSKGLYKSLSNKQLKIFDLKPEMM